MILSLLGFLFQLLLHFVIGVGVGYHAWIHDRNVLLWTFIGLILGPLGGILWILYLVFWVERR